MGNLIFGPVCPLEQETLAPDRSVGISVIIIEVSGDFDVRLKWYTTNTSDSIEPRLASNSVAKVERYSIYIITI